MGTIIVSGVGRGTTSLGIQAGALTKSVPVKVLSRNLLRYGPVSETSFGDSATVNADGTLNITSKNALYWRGIRWDQDASNYTPGSTISLSCANLPKNCEIFLRFNDDPSETGTLIYPARGSNKSSGTVPATVNSVFMAIRRKNIEIPMTAANVNPMVNVGKVLPFEKPDVTDWGGESFELANLFNLSITLPATKNGVTASSVEDRPGVYHLTGTSTGWASFPIRGVDVEAGRYSYGCDNASNWNYGGQIKLTPSDGGTEVSRLISVAGEIDLPAGRLVGELFVVQNKTVDVDLRPYVYKID